MRFVATKKEVGRVNKKNDSLRVTIPQLVDMFYRSRFNRDPLHGVATGEDIDNSTRHRIYNKKDINELMKLFAEFFEWVINAKNISKIYCTQNMHLDREPKYPMVKYATGLDERYTNNECTAGEYYITNGRYNWRLWLTGEPFEEMKKLWLNDPEFQQMKIDLIPLLEEKNKNVRERKNKDKSSQ